MKKTLSLVCVAALLTACASAPMGTNYVPVIDTQGVDIAKYNTDITECQNIAKVHRSDTAQKAMAGAIAGALIGALIAPRGYRNDVAGRTAVMGGAAGAGRAIETQESVIKRCMAGRGYRVLD